MKTKYNITEINPKSIKEIRQIIRDSLNVIFEDNNLVLDFGNATYDDDSVKFTNFKVRLATAYDPKLKYLKNYLKYSEHDFDLDKILIDRNDQYKLVGFKPRSSKRPFIIENINTNKTYVCDEKMIVRLYREQS